MTTHTYSQPGRKAVTLTVTDEGGNSDSVQHAVTVTARLATASFTGPAAVGAGHSAAFDASGSSDPNGTITSYRWDFGDGQTSTRSTPTASHTYAIAGLVTVTLTITDKAENCRGPALAKRPSVAVRRAKALRSQARRRPSNPERERLPARCGQAPPDPGRTAPAGDQTIHQAGSDPTGRASSHSDYR